jgi:uncharacterized protein YeaO (DUF488 family)
MTGAQPHEPAGSTDLRIKRVYEPPAPTDGTRILVDRLWPRGLTKERARVDLWLKEIAPSTEIRRRFGHDPARWAEFQARYRAELAANADPVARLRAEMACGPVTLIYGAKDEAHNDAIVLRDFLSR